MPDKPIIPKRTLRRATRAEVRGWRSNSSKWRLLGNEAPERGSSQLWYDSDFMIVIFDERIPEKRLLRRIIVSGVDEEYLAAITPRTREVYLSVCGGCDKIPGLGNDCSTGACGTTGISWERGDLVFQFR